MCIVRAWWWFAKTSRPGWDGIHTAKCQCIWCFHGFIHYCGSDACSVHVGMKRLEFPACEQEKVALFASCQYFCLLIFTLLRLAWPESQAPDLNFMFHLSLFFFPPRCIYKNTDRVSQQHHTETTLKAPPQRKRSKSIFLSPHKLHAFPSRKRCGFFE